MEKEETKKKTVKKETTKTTTKKQTTVKKETKPVKKETKKQEIKEEIAKASINQEKALAITFIILAVLVVILLVVAITQKEVTETKKESHITIPVLQEGTESSITINLKDFEKTEDDEYVFIVSNFREEEMIKENLEYDIEITNESNIDIELYKNNGKKNLIKEDLEVEDNKLSKKEKQEDVYRLVIKRNDKITDNSVIRIEIYS